MFKWNLALLIVLAQPVIGKTISTATETCIIELLSRSGNIPYLSDFEERRAAEINQHFVEMQSSLLKLAKSTASFDQNGKLFSFKRSRRDEVFHTAIYLCLK